MLCSEPIRTKAAAFSRHHTGVEADKRTGRPMCGRADSQMGGQADGQMDGWTGRQVDGRADGWAKRRADEAQRKNDGCRGKRRGG